MILPSQTLEEIALGIHLPKTLSAFISSILGNSFMQINVRHRVRHWGRDDLKVGRRNSRIYIFPHMRVVRGVGSETYDAA